MRGPQRASSIRGKNLTRKMQFLIIRPNRKMRLEGFCGFWAEIFGTGCAGFLRSDLVESVRLLAGLDRSGARPGSYSFLDKVEGTYVANNTSTVLLCYVFWYLFSVEPRKSLQI